MKLITLALFFMLVLAGIQIVTLQDTIYQQESYIDMLQDTIIDYEEEVD